jgi:putative membrane protein
MKKSWILMLCLAALVACRQETNTASDTTDTTMTSVSMTDTSSTTSTTTPIASTTGSASPLTEEEKTFAMKVAQGGMAEVTLGGIAAQKATNGDVKNFGNQMVTDHGKANDQLRTWATNKGIALPSEMGEEHKKTAADLSNKSGAAFDKAYMDAMVEDHEKDVRELQHAKSTVKDPDLKQWVDTTLPVIEGHLQMAKDVRNKLK